jgi:hypothetical protein
MLRELEANELWVAEMPSKLLGVEFGARSTLVRLSDGSLWVHSPIQLSDELRRNVEELGPVRAIIAPNKMHYAYLESWIKAYPEAAVFIAPDFKRAVSTTPKVLSDAVEPLWQDVLQQTVLRGSGLVQEVDFYHPRSKTLILTDLAFNIPTSQRPLMQKMAAKIIGVRDGFSPSRTFQMTTSDKAVLRDTLHKVLEWDFQRIIVAHGDIVENNGPQVLREAFAWTLQN